MAWLVNSAYAQEATPAPAQNAAPAPAPAEPTPAAPAPAVAPAPAAMQPSPPAAETHSEVGAAGAEHKGPFPPFDTHTFPSQILWFIVCFGVLYLMMKRVLVPRIGSIVEGRAAKISGDIEEAQRLRATSDTALAAYEKALAEARSSAHLIAQTATDEAKTAATKTRADVEAGLAAKLADAEARIAGIKDKALADVSAIAHETATAVVAALTGQEPAADEVAAAVSSVRAK